MAEPDTIHIGERALGNANGTLLLYVLDAVLLTVPVSLILIWLYRRSVERGMHASGAVCESAAPFDPASESRESCNAVDIGNQERRQRLWLTVVYTVAGILAAGLWTWLLFHAFGVHSAFQAFVIWYACCWPVPATLVTLLAVGWRRSLWLAGAYLVAGLLIICAWSTAARLASGHQDISVIANSWYFLYFMAIEAAPPALLIWISSHRRIRGVSPLALAGLLVFTFGSVAATQVFLSLLDVGGLRNLLLRLGPNWWFMAATVPIGYLCWLLLALLNAGYRRKAFSDVQLVTDSFWLIIAFVFSAERANVHWEAIAGLGVFAAYRGIVQLGLAIRSRHTCRDRGMTLLILRVFGFRRRSENLFDAIVQRWRFRGGVAMIAGGDLAGRAIDPDQTLAFLVGDLRSRFVQGERDLRERLSLMHESRDPDGRFRVTEFFCHENTWAGTLRAVLGRSDAILMDLRGFSEKNSGCIFELQELSAQRRLADTVFVIDKSTDYKLFESAIRNAAHPVGDVARLRLETVESGTAAEQERVYRSLCLKGCTSA